MESLAWLLVKPVRGILVVTYSSSLRLSRHRTHAAHLACCHRTSGQICFVHVATLGGIVLFVTSVGRRLERARRTTFSATVVP